MTSKIPDDSIVEVQLYATHTSMWVTGIVQNSYSQHNTGSRFPIIYYRVTFELPNGHTSSDTFDQSRVRRPQSC